MVHAIDTPGNQAGQFSDGNPLASPKVPSTIVGADWLNMVQEELEAVVLASGAPLDKSNNGQLLEALQAIVPILVQAEIGKEVAFLAAGDLTAGEGLIQEDTFGVVKASVSTGAPAAIYILGQFVLPKPAVSIQGGERVFWDNVAKEVTNVSASGRWSIGVAASTALAGSSTVLVSLAGANAPAELVP